MDNISPNKIKRPNLDDINKLAGIGAAIAGIGVAIIAVLGYFGSKVPVKDPPPVTETRETTNKQNKTEKSGTPDKPVTQAPKAVEPFPDAKRFSSNRVQGIYHKLQEAFDQQDRLNSQKGWSGKTQVQGTEPEVRSNDEVITSATVTSDGVVMTAAGNHSIDASFDLQMTWKRDAAGWRTTYTRVDNVKYNMDGQNITDPDIIKEFAKFDGSKWGDVIPN